MIRIVTVEREYGSGAASIAQEVAGRLGWKLWDKEITEEIARRLHCKAEQVEEREERVDSMFYRLMKVFMRGSFEPAIDTSDLELLDSESLAQLFEKVVRDIAELGNCVIMGRAAPWFLRDRKDAFHVFLYAPYEEKLRRVLAWGQSRKDAEFALENVDRERVAFVRKYYGKDWPDRYLYNMMINTRFGDEAAVDAIMHQIERLGH